MTCRHYFYQLDPPEMTGLKPHISTCSRERIKTVDLFPRTETPIKTAIDLFPRTDKTKNTYQTSI